MAADLSKDLGGVLSSLLSSPEVLGKLLSVLGSLGAGDGEGSADGASAVSAESGGETDGQARTQQAQTVAASALPAATGERRDAKNREGLLRALRPYLSPARCERLDALVRVSSMLDYLHTDRKV